MFLIACVGFYLLYTLVFSGRFADWMVRAYQGLFRLDYEHAYNLYQYTFRNYTDVYMIVTVAGMFLVMFRIYLNWFTDYFDEIGRGLDRLLQEQTEEISLSPELLPLERKLNLAKHTVEAQKEDILSTEKRKNDLIMYLAHDLKTPLASVIGYLNLLHDEKEISEDVRDKYVSIALDKAGRLEELINEFFEIARFNLSDISLQYSKISLTRLLEQLLYEFDPMLKEKGLTGKLDMDAEIMLQCDADKIQRVFDNLLRNAVMYSREGGEIVIQVRQCPAPAGDMAENGIRMEAENGIREKAEYGARREAEGGSCEEVKSGARMEAESEVLSGAGAEDPMAVVSVINAGDSIPHEKLERIFEQFYRLDNARGTKNGGAGLGLAIAKQIVTLHGGNIRAQSGDGRTCFTVTLPVKQ